MTLAVKLELISLAAVIIGVAMISLPFAFIVGGVAGFLLAQGIKP